eukprot:SAG25_NODE_4974_length_721_cov_1.122186_1_plen_41_part_10
MHDSVDADFAAMVDSWGTVLPDAPAAEPTQARKWADRAQFI